MNNEEINMAKKSINDIIMKNNVNENDIIKPDMLSILFMDIDSTVTDILNSQDVTNYKESYDGLFDSITNKIVEKVNIKNLSELKYKNMADVYMYLIFELGLRHDDIVR